MAIIQPAQLATGSYSLSGSFSGSFQGNGAGLNNIPSSAIVGLSSTQIASGNVTASVSTGTGSFTVTSGSSTFMFVSSSGNVGIGTSTTQQKLNILGNNFIMFTGVSAQNTPAYIGTGADDNFYVYSAGQGSGKSGYYGPSNGTHLKTYSGAIELYTGNGAPLLGLKIVAGTSNVLIGTSTDAGYKLDVNGTARFTSTVRIQDTLQMAYGSIIYEQGGGNYMLEGQALRFGNGIGLKFYSGATNSGSPDAGLYRSSAGTLRISDGSTGLGSIESSKALIGSTTETGHKLLVSGSGASGSVNLDNTLYVSGSNVGVGTTNPSTKLEIRNGNLKVVNSSAVDVFYTSANGQNYSYALNIAQDLRLQNNGTATSPLFSFSGTAGLFRTSTDGLGITVANTERLQITTAGNVLINTTTDAGYKLDVNGTARINTLNIGLGGGQLSTNTALGFNALNANISGSNLTAVGASALQNNTTGNENTAVGRVALAGNSTGNYNTAVGYNTLTSANSNSNTAVGQGAGRLVTGAGNTIMGHNAMDSGGVAAGNVSIGYYSLYASTASNNTAVGYQSGYSNTSGEVVAVGYKSLFSNSTGLGNTAVGFQSQVNTNTGGYNTAVGSLTMQSNTNGSQNSAFGQAALQNNTTGNDNTGIGMQSLYSNTSGGQNTSLGFYSLRSNTTGSSNVALGYMALRFNDASQNTAIGYGAGYGGIANVSGSNNIFIGYNSTGVTAGESNRTWIGNSSTTSTWLAGNILIGTTTDSGYKLDVNGTARVSGQFDVISGTANFRVNNNGTYVQLGIGSTAWATYNAGETYYGGSQFFYQAGANFRFAGVGQFGFTGNPSNSAILQADSTTKGFLPPRMTTTQKTNISSPAEGLMVYDTDLKRPCFYNGTSWVTL